VTRLILDWLLVLLVLAVMVLIISRGVESIHRIAEVLR